MALSRELARGADGDVKGALASAAAACDPVEVEETILQSYLFCGYPTALNAFAAWRALSGRPASGVEPGGWSDWEARGAEVCARVYGGQYAGLRDNIRALSPEMERWMVTEGYGKVLGRPGLPMVRREYGIVAILAVQGVPTQLYSHLRGALQVGGDVDTLDAVLETALVGVSEDRSEVARATWARLRERMD